MQNKEQVVAAIKAQDLNRLSTLMGNGTTLDVSENNFNRRSLDTIAEYIRTNNTLKILYMSRVGLGPKGGQIIAEGIKDNNTLEYLSFRLSPLGPVGVKAIVKALEDNKSVTTLDITYNNIADGFFGASCCCPCWLPWMCSCPTIDKTNIRHVQHEIVESLKKNTSLTEINIGNREYESPYQDTINKIAERNSNKEYQELLHHQKRAPEIAKLFYENLPLPKELSGIIGDYLYNGYNNTILNAYENVSENQIQAQQSQSQAHIISNHLEHKMEQEPVRQLQRDNWVIQI